MKEKILAMENISLEIPGNKNAILHNINYVAHDGDFIILLGSNGSGKSSLLKILDRRYKITQGKIMLYHKNLAQYKQSEFCECLTTLTQNPRDSLFCSLTVLENSLLIKMRHEKNLFSLQHHEEREFFENYLSKFNVNLAKKLDTPAQKLSGGEQQTLTLALSVLYPPKVLLLDEHTSALDPNTAQHLMEITAKTVKEHKITCFLATHDLNLALKYGNRILALKDGEIFTKIDEEEKNKLTKETLLTKCYQQ